MTYTYPATVPIVYFSERDDLSIRVFLLRELEGSNGKALDPTKLNSWESTTMTAEQVDGGVKSNAEPLILPRQKNLDLKFRRPEYFTYSTILKDLKAGDYAYLLEVRLPDRVEIINGKQERTMGDLVETVQKQFTIEHSPMDRVLCVGYNQEKEPVFRSIADMIKATYMEKVTQNFTDLEVNTKFWEVKFPNVPEGTKVMVQAKKFYEPELYSDLLGRQFEYTISNGKIKFRPPFGDYIFQFKGHSATIKQSFIPC